MRSGRLSTSAICHKLAPTAFLACSCNRRDARRLHRSHIREFAISARPIRESLVPLARYVSCLGRMTARSSSALFRLLCCRAALRGLALASSKVGECFGVFALFKQAFSPASVWAFSPIARRPVQQYAIKKSFTAVAVSFIVSRWGVTPAAVVSAVISQNYRFSHTSNIPARLFVAVRPVFLKRICGGVQAVCVQGV